MLDGYRKYVPFPPVDLPGRQWPGRVIDRAPTWCSVDLRDGNQALVDPMDREEKLLMFRTLCEIGIKEIEVGFPSASETEYDILRTLIEEGHIPDDVTIQVLVQARPHLIRKTFDAIRGAKKVIFHFYNSISALQRKVVFHTDVAGVEAIAVEGARLIRELSRQALDEGMDLRFEYSPESFSGTEPEVAVRICASVLDALGATAVRPVILNLPATVEGSTPNVFADQVEYFITHLPGRERAIVSVHPHNDRGTAVAAAELAVMAGAERVEGTLFGNGERTGNVDLVTLAMNLYTQGVDPRLDLSRMGHIKEVYEQTTHMKVGERHPYAGALVFTAFSGSHQDAINKGTDYMRRHGGDVWEIPYLPIDPADVGREYEPIVRINSQSGKGGAAFVLHNEFGYNLPKAMHPEFGAVVKAACDAMGTEMSSEQLLDLFRREYIDVREPYRLERHKFHEQSHEGETVVDFEGTLSVRGSLTPISGEGNGPIDAFFNALKRVGIQGYEFVSYHEHAISAGSDSKAIAYIELKKPDGRNIFGVGISHNINLASLRGVLCAINRAERADA